MQARKVLSKMAAQQATLPTDTERPFLPASARMAALNAVNSGGSNIGARFRPPKPCPRCNYAVETAEHRYFTCPANTCPELLEVAPAIEDKFYFSTVPASGPSGPVRRRVHVGARPPSCQPLHGSPARAGTCHDRGWGFYRCCHGFGRGLHRRVGRAWACAQDCAQSWCRRRCVESTSR